MPGWAILALSCDLKIKGVLHNRYRDFTGIVKIAYMWDNYKIMVNLM